MICQIAPVSDFGVFGPFVHFPCWNRVCRQGFSVGHDAEIRSRPFQLSKRLPHFPKTSVDMGGYFTLLLVAILEPENANGQAEGLTTNT